ncbi:hypothetical protein KIH86_13270 [Paenibacillus sp. HN-1]|uniref:hypothetical protein n=1 Tax=Paenibacillus TaxID=44249 RepID=UPI001CA81AA6|nr:MULTISPECIES: hypothetical protein [Paenibacillus]MBY9080810.1 hypothetical protein [Paenibacillus sp. CGMCC 1.18879]MBY9085198.1 hypothetical protein [Paenibacillus sinensis]
MSYDIHITRASHWMNYEELPISLEELKEYFSSKPDFEYSKLLTIATDPFTMTIQGDFFIWKSEEGEIPFRLTNGNLALSNGDDEFVMDKMKEIAADLHAIVQGDEGEIY